MVNLPGHWEFYNTFVEEAPAAVFVNLDVGKPMPDPARPVLLVTRIWLEDPSEIGLATPEELDWIVEKGLFQPEEVCNRLRARFVGHLVSQGCFDAFYYISEAQAQKAEEVLSTLWPNVTHKHAHNLVADEDWGQYRNFLCPSPFEYRTIQNRDKLEEYRREHLGGLADPDEHSKLIAEQFGMDLEQVKAINQFAAGQVENVLQYQRETLVHSLFFTSAQARRGFAKGVDSEGFGVVGDLPPDPSMDPTPFGLLVEREESMLPHEIDEAVMSLWSRAEEFGGRYNDWEVANEDE